SHRLHLQPSIATQTQPPPTQDQLTCKPLDLSPTDWYGCRGHVIDGYEREFDEIRKILIEKSVDAYVDEISKNEDRILDMMVNEPYEFSGRICHQNTGSGVWAEIPIFVSIDQEKFVDSFLRAPAKYWRILANALMNRYKLIGRSGEKINDEREWMRSVLKLLNEKKDHLDPLNKFRLDRFVNWNEFEKVLAREI
ncbi:hypothetical protein, partial [Comamonas thiooxydans]|uniref:hypothetical protein n=1 Tax=Comamonas thiooxydans TaxID=363952 RepID=UPI001556E80D